MAMRVRSRYDPAPATLAIVTTITSASPGNRRFRDLVAVITAPPLVNG
jgi:hypothetical protein